MIGVKREVPSRGGSQCLHETVREGDVLAISEPRNNFPLRRDAVRTIFIAGGIGITPLLAMAQALHHSSLVYELHYFARSQEAARLPGAPCARFGDRLTTHLDLSPAATEERIRALLSNYRPAHAGLCLRSRPRCLTRRAASPPSWAGRKRGAFRIFQEHARDRRQLDISRSRWRVRSSRWKCRRAKRSCRCCATAASAFRRPASRAPAALVSPPCSKASRIHQDVYLSDGEKRSGTKIITCVSRAKSARLVLDL